MGKAASAFAFKLRRDKQVFSPRRTFGVRRSPAPLEREENEAHRKKNHLGMAN